MMMITDLPDDLEAEILSRVPAKSLWELRTTCKRWYALFRDPRFVENNKKLGKAARESILHSNYGVYSTDKDLYGIYKKGVEPSSIEFTGKLISLKHSKDLKIYRIYQCNGLMLCSTKENTRLVVWNPCTGETRSIKPRTCYRRDDINALGYVVNRKSCCPSYKILRLCSYENEEKVRVQESEIYELSSDSWRVLNYFSGDKTIHVYAGGMSLKGDTYFVARVEETGFLLLKFDFTTERFVRLPLPFQSFDPKDTVALSVVRDEKLSVLHVLASSKVMKIWVTNKTDDEEAKDLSWRSDFVLVVDFDKLNLPSVASTVSSFLLDEENKVAVCCDLNTDDDYRTTIYIVGEDMFKQVYKDITKESPPNWPLILTYVPSLVPIRKDTPKKAKETQPKVISLIDYLVSFFLFDVVMFF